MGRPWISFPTFGKNSFHAQQRDGGSLSKSCDAVFQRETLLPAGLSLGSTVAKPGALVSGGENVVARYRFTVRSVHLRQ
jgi:hypothetical protein